MHVCRAGLVTILLGVGINLVLSTSQVQLLGLTLCYKGAQAPYTWHDTEREYVLKSPHAS
jgi:hypothetical protein